MVSETYDARVCFPLAGESELQWIRFRRDESEPVAYREKLSKGLIQFGLQSQAASAFADWCHIIGRSDYAREKPQIEYLLGGTTFRGRSFFLAMTLAHLRATAGDASDWTPVCATGDVVEQAGQIRILPVEEVSFAEKITNLVEAVRSNNERIGAFIYPQEQPADTDTQGLLDELEALGVEVRPAEWIDELEDLFESPSSATIADAWTEADHAFTNHAAEPSHMVPQGVGGVEPESSRQTARAAPFDQKEPLDDGRRMNTEPHRSPSDSVNRILNFVIVISTLVLAVLAIKYRWGWDDVEPYLAASAAAILAIALSFRLTGAGRRKPSFIDATASPTPALTRQNLAKLESAGFTDSQFQKLHHWGNRKDRDGSLDSHKRYLTGVRRYHAGSNNAVLARRVDFVARNLGGKSSLNQLCQEARVRYPFGELNRINPNQPPVLPSTNGTTQLEYRTSNEVQGHKSFAEQEEAYERQGDRYPADTQTGASQTERMDADTSPTPALTLENLVRLEAKGFEDKYFRTLHHWGSRQDRDGSLDSHKRYLTGVKRYHAGSNNAVLARRIDFVAKNIGGMSNLNQLCREARDRYPFGDGQGVDSRPSTVAPRSFGKRMEHQTYREPKAKPSGNSKIESVEIEHRVILININLTFRYDMSPEALYEATRGVWRIGKRRENVDYAFAVYQGIVREVYRIKSWLPAGTLKYHHREDLDESSWAGRWEFVGSVANDVRDRYVGKSVRRYLPLRGQNPIRYVNV